MDFTLQPSLQQFSAVRIAVELWKSRDIRDELESTLSLKHRVHHSLCEDYYEQVACRKELLKKVSAKLAQLPLPNSLKDIVRDILKPIGYEITKVYGEIIDLDKTDSFEDYFYYLRWTPWGKVDKQRTMELFFDDEDLDVVQRYAWACCYTCGGYEDKFFWRQLSRQANLEIQKRSETVDWICTGLELKGCWTLRKVDLLLMRREIGNPVWDNYLQNCLTCKFVRNTGMTFLQLWLASSQCTKRCIVNEFVRAKLEGCVCCPEVLFFLITQMTRKQQKTFFKRNAKVLFLELLNDWTRREQLTEYLQLILIDLSIRYLKRELLRVDTWREIEAITNIADFQDLFELIWFKCTYETKLQVMNRWDFLKPFVISMDVKSIRLILKCGGNVVEYDGFLQGLRENLFGLPTHFWRTEFDSIDSFIRNVQFNEKDIKYLKSSFLYRNHFKICRELIALEEWQTLGKLEKWAFNGELEINSFKREFAYSQSGMACYYYFVNKCCTMVMDAFMNWCFLTENDKKEFKIFINKCWSIGV